MLTEISIFMEWWFFSFQWRSWHSLQPKQKRPLSCPSLVPQFGAHSSRCLCFLRLISQCVAICLCTINPPTGHHTVVFHVSSGKLCTMAAVQSEVHVDLVTALSDGIWVANAWWEWEAGAEFGPGIAGIRYEWLSCCWSCHRKGGAMEKCHSFLVSR